MKESEPSPWAEGLRYSLLDLYPTFTAQFYSSSSINAAASVLTESWGAIPEVSSPEGHPLEGRESGKEGSTWTFASKFSGEGQHEPQPQNHVQEGVWDSAAAVATKSAPFPEPICPLHFHHCPISLSPAQFCWFAWVQDHCQCTRTLQPSHWCSSSTRLHRLLFRLEMI